MLPLANRLKKKKDFESLFKNGKGFKEGFLYLKRAENGQKETRLGFVVGKNLSKKAVVRNRAKRKLRESAKKLMPEIKKGYDAAVIALPGFKEESFDLKKLFKKSGLIQ